MKIKRFLFFMLSISLYTSIIFGFSSDNSKIREYYKYIHYAEQNIINNNLKNACVNYKIAFSKTDRYFIKDCYNAFICSFRVSDYILAEKYMKLCIETGYKIDYINKNASLIDIWSNPNWNNIVSKYKNHKVSYDTTIYNKYLELKITDQKVRKYCQEYGGENYSYSAICVDSVKKVDYKNLDSFLSYINAYGFPDEKTSGVTSSFGLSNYYLTLLHNISWGNSNFLNTLKSLVYKGYYPPNNFIELTSREYETNKKNEIFNYGPPIGVQLDNSNNKTTLILIVSENEVDINAKRDSIYLEPLNELRAKIRFSINRRDYSLFNRSLLPFLDIDETQRQEIISKILLNYPKSIIINY